MVENKEKVGRYMEQGKKELLRVFTDKENNLLRIYIGKSEKEEYTDELKENDNVFFVETAGKHRISFECLKYLGSLLINNCVYPGERKKRKKELKDIMKLDKWM